MIISFDNPRSLLIILGAIILLVAVIGGGIKITKVLVIPKLRLVQMVVAGLIGAVLIATGAVWQFASASPTSIVTVAPTPTPTPPTSVSSPKPSPSVPPTNFVFTKITQKDGIPLPNQQPVPISVLTPPR